MSLESVPCAICQSAESAPFFRKFDLEIARCARCGLIYANPRLTQEDIWKRYSPEYFWKEYLPALGVQNGRFDLEFFDRRHASMLGLIATAHSGRGRLLEIGCGAGFFLKAAERGGWTVTGIEVSDEAVRFAHDRLELQVHQRSAETMEFEAGSFDVAVMFDVIEHLLHPLEALRAIRRVLATNGVLVISTPNIDALSRWGLGIEWAVLSPAEHLYYFSETSLERILAAAGFGSVEFVRRYAGFGVYETMNPRYTHAPHGLRARSYGAFVSSMGPLLFKGVQRIGKADTLVCVARRAEVRSP